MMTDSASDSRRAEEQGEAEELATCAGSSDADQRNPDLDRRRPESPAQDEAEELATSAGSDQRNPDRSRLEGASAVAQDDGKDFAATGGSFDTGKREPDVDVLAKGIASVLGPVMNNFDGGVEGVLKSQSILASSIDRLTRELDKLLEDVPHPYATHHATRLSGIRKRVIALNTSLHIIHKRMEMIQRLLAGYASRTGTGVKQGKVAMKGSHSGPGIDIDSNDHLSRIEDPEMSIFSENVPSEGLHDDNAQEKQDLTHASPHKNAFIDQEAGATSIARDEDAGDLDVKAN